MTKTPPPRRSPLALAVLALLTEAPMHPYHMQRLIKERGKDQVINVQQRASLYQTIERLERVGLIRVRATAREERRPERTIYELTEEGRRTAFRWLREMLATPAREFPEFPAAVSLLAMLPPAGALAQLAARAEALTREIARLDAEVAAVVGVLPRLFLLEAELLRATLSAELAWVSGVVDDLRAGRLTWDEAWVRQYAEALAGPEPPEGGAP
jgi:DNA-binding PadR family transcriptional regulator